MASVMEMDYLELQLIQNVNALRAIFVKFYH
jgi:hypothetical protein